MSAKPLREKLRITVSPVLHASLQASFFFQGLSLWLSQLSTFEILPRFDVFGEGWRDSQVDLT